MTYLDRINEFHLWAESHDLPVNAKLLYFNLLNVFNRAGWPRNLSVDTRRLMMLAECQKDAAFRMRDKLVEAGFVTYKKGRKGVSTQYSLPDSCGDKSFRYFKRTETPTQTPSETPTETPPPTTTQRERRKTKTKKDSSCAEQSSPPVIELPLNDGTEYAVSQEQCQEWAGLYPAVDVIQQLRHMRGWLMANPEKKKTRRGILRFVAGWI